MYEALTLQIVVTKSDLVQLLRGETVLPDLFVRGERVIHKAFSIQAQYDALELLPQFLNLERAAYGKAPVPISNAAGAAPPPRRRKVNRGKK